MTHKRIRRVVPTAATGSYSKAVLAGDTLYMSGQTGAGLDGSPPAPGDPITQTRQACENIQTLLTEAGGDLSDTVKLTVYITAREHRAPVYEVIAEYFGPHAPASTGLIVSGFASPDFLVEIDATAVLRRKSD
ncbi:MAG: RidA family protein [Alphaproteobacteria bacterium]|jgi:enamine deaminase RidA (YjgF/YER057c/UK114 family)|nr:RidA family protein [Alphaproteobacteria bacterium]